MVNSNNFIMELKKRNPQALEYVIDNFGNLVYKIAYGYLNSNELSEECLNDVLLKVWTCIEGYDYPLERLEFKGSKKTYYEL